MGEETEADIFKKLSLMRLPHKDLINMIKLNSRGDLGKGIPYETLMHICAHGMTYGGMKSVCHTCNSILHTDGRKYHCLGKTVMKSTCDYFRYHCETSNKWEIPDDVTENEELEKLMKGFNKYQVKSFLNQQQKDQRQLVINGIDSHKNYHFINDAEVMLHGPGFAYSYFCVMNDDLVGDYRTNPDTTSECCYCFGQVRKMKGSGLYVFYKEERFLKDSYAESYKSSSIDEVVDLFEHQFHCITENTWESWIEGNFVRIRNNFFPLKLDYFSRLSYLESQRIDEINEEFVVTSKYLEKLKINMKNITKSSIQNAQSITVRKVINGNVMLTFLDEFEKKGIYPDVRPAMESELDFLKDKEGLKFNSIVSRLLTPSAGITIRLADLPQKSFHFERIKDILSVFFKYQKLKNLETWSNLETEQFSVFNLEIWPSSLKELTQGHILDMTRGIIGSWIIELALSPDEQMHHHYIKQKGSGCCYWSVLLRKARKMSDSSSDRFILCTIDVEELPKDSKHDIPKDDKIVDKQSDIKEVSLSNFDEGYYNKCGYAHHSGDRAKMVMLFPIKYTASVQEPNDEEKKTWVEFIAHFYSSDTWPSPKLVDKAKNIYNGKKMPLIYLSMTSEGLSKTTFLPSQVADVEMNAVDDFCPIFHQAARQS